MFKDGSFREFKRWDDSFALRKVVENSDDLNCVDLVKNVAVPTLNVVGVGPFAKLIYHDKGRTTKHIFNKGNAI